MNYFSDLMALAEIALGAGVGFLITVWFFVIGSKARREHAQRGLKIEALRSQVAHLQMLLKENEDYGYDHWRDIDWTEEEEATPITTDGTY